MTSYLTVRGAREHNLQNVDAVIPKDSLTVITGLSGSGKSSLAFDTIYAEGQRRYVESLSSYARQFLELAGKPDVDVIEGLSPAISIEQKTTGNNPRSTVGTVTEIYDYMRLLWARVGIPYSPATGLPIEAQTVSQMTDKTAALPIGSRQILSAPVIKGRKGEYRKELAVLQSKGFTRVKVDGTLYQIDEVPPLNRKLKHDIELVVDRWVIQENLSKTRLAESFETALSFGNGIAYVENADNPEEKLIFSARFACPVSGFTIEEIEPRLFSFNAPHGACKACEGLGTETFFSPELIIPKDTLSLAQGAIAPWHEHKNPYYRQLTEQVAAYLKIKLTTPWRDIPADKQEALLYGTGEDPVRFTFIDRGREMTAERPFPGIIAQLALQLRQTDSPRQREELTRYQAQKPCSVCFGARLKPEALAVKVAGLSIAEAADLSIGKALIWFQNVLPTLTPQRAEIAQRILREINDRLHFLVNVGLDYLTLSRGSASLSGGESQRIRLAGQIGSGLTGVLYVLDEPSIGLHQRDNERLLQTLQRLKNLGNTVLVVEHDEDAIRSADYIIDMGPGAGVHGGKIVASGTAAEIEENPASLTGAYLSGRKKIPLPEIRRQAKEGQKLKLFGASGNNLQNVDIEIPLGTFCCITGVSGSGKSTLILDTLYKAAARQIIGISATPEPFERIEGLEFLDKVIDIDQSPIGRTPRSNPATYTDLFTPVRDWFTGLPEAKARGYKAGRFSFNVKGGRCEACQGDGVIKIEMHFLPDVFVTCDTCQGKRYNRETLEILFKGKSIADVLEMSVDEAADFFVNLPKVREKLLILQKVGLGYIRLGQQATTLSGGEAQRIKLAKELSRRATGKTLYILDEPTTGLHFEDVRKLLEVLQALTDQGNTVLVIEHNLDMIKAADMIIDLGPEGGSGGGQIVAAGTPEEIIRVKASHTGRFLAPLLQKEQVKEKVKEKTKEKVKIKPSKRQAQG